MMMMMMYDDDDDDDDDDADDDDDDGGGEGGRGGGGALTLDISRVSRRPGTSMKSTQAVLDSFRDMCIHSKLQDSVKFYLRLGELLQIHLLLPLATSRM